MFERVNTIIEPESGQKVKAITIKVKVASKSSPWKVADIQFQEGAVVTEYTEHVAEMERRGG